jgi:spore maturation protein SpmB
VFAGSAFSAAPFSASGGAVFDAAVSETVTVTGLESSAVTYVSAVELAAASGSDAVAVAASIFNAFTQDTVQGAATIATSVDFAVSVHHRCAGRLYGAGVGTAFCARPNNGLISL